ncbi:hypothetical protein ACD401_03315
MSKYNFDRVIDRVGTDCVKWDFRTNCSTKAQKDGLPFGLLIWILNVQNQ